MAEMCFIVITAFAVFGLYCLVENIIYIVKFSSLPKSVTVMACNYNEKLFPAINYIHNALYNNEIVLLSESEAISTPLVTVVNECEISQYITNALFTKNDN